MNLNRIWMILFGVLILAVSLLAKFHHANWPYLLMFMGFMTAQAGITGFCPSRMLLKALGLKEKSPVSE